MPSDYAIMVSTGIGVGVFAGVLSGVCYVLVHGFSRKRNWNPTVQWYCALCGHRFRSNLLGKIKTCAGCGERVCKTSCSKRDLVTKDWICLSCLKRSTPLSSFLGSIVQYLKRVSSAGNTFSEESGRIMGKSVDDAGVSRSEEGRESVRDFIETLVSTIVGGSVDDASIFRMYNDKCYIALFNRYHQDLSEAITKLSSALQISMKDGSFSEQNPSSAHTNVKRLIEKILSETRNLPRFRRPVSNPTTPEEVTYEDLLATAVLNKIINKKEAAGDETPSKYTARDESRGAKHRKFDTPSASSVDEHTHSDSSQSSSDFVDRVSLTIHQQIEDIPSAKLRNHVATNDTLIDHRSNWHLQKRPFHEGTSPLNVPMLVPNPLTSAKVLIGDTEADETSDLSDANSNSDHEDETAASPDGQFLIDSTVTIEQKIPSYYVSDEETSFDSGVREDRDDFNDKDTFYFTEHTNISFDNEHEKVASLSSSASNVERDSEYLEHYSSLPNITYTSAYSYQPRISTQDEKPKTNISTQDRGEDPVKEETDFEGSYTKKEKEKWKHPVRMSYNPYSEENIRKRIHTNERYGRDYYTRQASLPSGRARSDEIFSFAQPDDETTLYRAEPVTLNSQLETGDSYTGPNLDDAYYAEEVNSDLNFRNENINISNRPPKEEITVVVEVNQKTPVYADSGDFANNSKDHHTKSIDVVLKNDANRVGNSKDHYTKSIDVVLKNDANRVGNSKDHYTKSIDVVLKNDANRVGVPDRVEQIPSFKEKRLVPAVNLSEPIIKDSFKDNFEPPSPVVVSKRSDNTLIKKIYSNPVVRNFAMTTRETTPGMEDVVKKPTSEQLNTKPNTPRNYPNPNSPMSPVFNYAYDRQISIKNDFQLEWNHTDDPKVDSDRVMRKDASRHNFSLEFSDNEDKTSDNDVNELREMKLVANRLDQFSKSYPSVNNTTVPIYRRPITQVIHVPEEEPSEAKDLEPIASFVSVKDLKKLFEKSDVASYSKDKPVHSLTARSISKEIRKTRLQ